MDLGLIKRYQSFLPVSEKTPFLTLYEGNTPLIKAKQLSQELKLDLYLKAEGFNPTGSFKDRGMVMAIVKAAEARQSGGNMCIYRKYFRFCCCLCGSNGTSMHCGHS